jgi:acyl-coenzyme A thioesterase PaaI-like protein
VAIGDVIRFDAEDNMCFGCSQHNERGLHLSFTHVGPSAVETTYRAPDHTCGAPGVMHGGIQAALIDEAIGFAIHVHDQPDAHDLEAERQRIVTMEFDLRYRRPVPVGEDLVLRAEVVRESGDDYLAVGEIVRDGQVLTSATAKWRRLR